MRHRLLLRALRAAARALYLLWWQAAPRQPVRTPPPPPVEFTGVSSEPALDTSWAPDLASRRTKSSSWDFWISLSMVTGTMSPILDPPLRTVQPESQFVVGTTEAPIVGTTEAPIVGTTEAPVVGTTAAPVVGTTEVPVVGTTEAPVVGTTEAPIVATTEAPIVGTTEAPVVGTTEAPVVGTTAAPVVGTTEVPVVGTTEAPGRLRLTILPPAPGPESASRGDELTARRLNRPPPAVRRAQKTNSVVYGAFSSPGYPELATLGVEFPGYPLRR
eukprot:1181940-Prorocentrum_minimum.AAC.1